MTALRRLFYTRTRAYTFAREASRGVPIYIPVSLPLFLSLSPSASPPLSLSSCFYSISRSVSFIALVSFLFLFFFFPRNLPVPDCVNSPGLFTYHCPVESTERLTPLYWLLSNALHLPTHVEFQNKRATGSDGRSGSSSSSLYISAVSTF
jgi:hypothetical protein